MSILGDAITTVLNAGNQIKGEPIRYRTPNRPDITIDLASPLKGKQAEELEDRTAFLNTAQDWGIPRAALDAENVTPAPGHQILRTLQGIDLTYTLTPGPDGQCWEWRDAAQTHYRIHTKLTTKP